MPSITIDGRTRIYEDEGEGPAVILVHGSLSGARQWRKLGERLRGRFRLLAADLYAADGMMRGEGSAFENDCALVDALIAIGGGEGSLVGHSYGGVVAMRAALGRRDALSGLVLIEPSCFHLLRQEGAAEFSEIADMRSQQVRLAAAGDLAGSARFFIDYWMGAGAFDAMPERRREAIVAGVPRVAQEWPGTWDDVTTLSDYRGLALRTLLMGARDTRAPSARIVEMIRAAMPNFDAADLASGGHMAPIVNPDPVNDAIVAFLDRIPAR
ncbi:MAG: alpha/beta hydrolase [Pseudorhodoplanes sp.]|nr:alpha/beta hydrolase [Pseudorhodoplanes sp.]